MLLYGSSQVLNDAGYSFLSSDTPLSEMMPVSFVITVCPTKPFIASVHWLKFWYDAWENENAPCSSLYSILRYTEESSSTTLILCVLFVESVEVKGSESTASAAKYSFVRTCHVAESVSFV